MVFDLPYGYPAVTLENGVVVGEAIEVRNVNAALRILDSLEESGERALEGVFKRAFITV